MKPLTIGIVIAVVAVVALGGILALSQSGNGSSPGNGLPSPQAAESAVVSGLKLTVTVADVSVQQGEMLSVTFDLTNTGNEELTFSTSSSKLFDFTIDAGGASYTWSSDMQFTQVITPYTLSPSETISRTLEWPVNLQPSSGQIVGSTAELTLGDEKVTVTASSIDIQVV